MPPPPPGGGAYGADGADGAGGRSGEVAVKLRAAPLVEAADAYRSWRDATRSASVPADATRSFAASSSARDADFVADSFRADPPRPSA